MSRDTMTSPRAKARPAAPDSGAGDPLFLSVLDRLRETREGRWLICEFAHADLPDMPREKLAAPQTAPGILSALAGDSSDSAKLAELRAQLRTMFASITATRNEIAALRAPHGLDGKAEEAASELDAIVQATEAATSSILEAAERMDGIATRVAALDGGGPEALAESDTIGELTAEIFTACSFQDITGQRIGKVVRVVKELEATLAAMTGGKASGPAADARPDAHLLNGPARDGEGVDQAAVDALFD